MATVLILGGGGREHALAWGIAQSPRVDKVYVSPGNAGTSRAEKCENVALSGNAETIAFCKEHAVSLVVIGPEAPLVAGTSDALRAAGNDLPTLVLSSLGDVILALPVVTALRRRWPGARQIRLSVSSIPDIISNALASSTTPPSSASRIGQGSARFMRTVRASTATVSASGPSRLLRGLVWPPIALSLVRRSKVYFTSSAVSVLPS